LIQEALAQSITQWTALISGIVYVVLAARERALCWVFGIVSCSFIAWDDFFSFQLYADGVLQLIYVVLGVVGLYNWRYGGIEQSKLRISEHPLRRHLTVIAASIVLSLPVSYLLMTYSDASFGFLDVLTTILSLYATWLLIYKVLSNWLYWIVIDAVYVYLFIKTGGTLIALLYAVYFVVAIYGYVVWSKKRRRAGLQIPILR
jgi:nicotinamide mononucleotide transporter